MRENREEFSVYRKVKKMVHCNIDLEPLEIETFNNLRKVRNNYFHSMCKIRSEDAVMCFNVSKKIAKWFVE